MRERLFWKNVGIEPLIAWTPKVHLKFTPRHPRDNPEILQILMFGDTKRHPRDNSEKPQEHPQVKSHSDTPQRHPRDIPETP